MPQPCTCPESLSHIEELCETCQREYINWLETENHNARAEARVMSAAELFGHLIAADLEVSSYAA